MIESKYLRMLFEEEESQFVLSISWMERKFDIFNDEYFGGKLPIPEFVIDRKKKTHGLCRAIKKMDTGRMEYTIFLSKYYNKMTEYDMENILIHEMIHFCNYIDNGFEYMVRESKNAEIKGHGKSFIQEMERINAIGKHNITIFGVSNGEGGTFISSDLRDYTEEMKNYKLLLLTRDDKVYGLNASLKVIEEIKQDLNKYNIFICTLREPTIFSKFPKIFRHNQKIKVYNLLGHGLKPDEMINSKKMELDDVYIKGGYKLMYKPSVITMEYLTDPQSYIESGEKNCNDKVSSENINESANRRKKKYLDKLDIDAMKKVFDNVEIDGDELIVDIE